MQQRGAEWLDKVFPDWWRHINLETLDIERSNVCIIGQLTRVSTTFSKYLITHGYAETNKNVLTKWLIPYYINWGMLKHLGFVPNSSNGPELTQAWTMEIEARRLVDNGVKYLDEKIPDWYNYINVESLDIRCTHFCIIGQLCVAKKIQTPVYVQYYGFYHDDEAMYPYLTASWKRVVIERQNEPILVELPYVDHSIMQVSTDH